MSPLHFFEAHGLIVEDLRNDGLWHRVPTTDHPKKRNGAYRWDNDIAFCQNWATMTDTASWKDDTVRPISDADRARMAAKRQERQETEAEGWARAARRAQSMIDSASLSHHGYLMRKGFGEEPALVLPDGAMFVPMRSLATNELVGGQVIRWMPAEAGEQMGRWDKKFMPGMRSRGAIYRLGPLHSETILCEGMATGYSIEKALRELRMPMGVLVCFSAHNIVHVAPLVRGKAFVFADHDAPQRDPAKALQNPGEAGQRAAAATGLPWTMAPTEGHDANDVDVKLGRRQLAKMLLDLRRLRRPPDWAPHWPQVRGSAA
jgi:putative DNA primase/helicase